jgi:hypothetical protein
MRIDINIESSGGFSSEGREQAEMATLLAQVVRQLLTGHSNGLIADERDHIRVSWETQKG